MQRVRVGLIGAGWVAVNRHLPALQKIPEADLNLIWSRNRDKARDVAGRFGVRATVSRWQDVIHSSEVDAVVIATPPVLHLPATVEALEAGKHVLCQARMARNLDEARKMAAAAQASRLVTALYPPLPGLKGDRVMIRLLHEEGFVGQIREVRITGMSVDTDPESYRSYRWDPQVSGINTMTLGMWNEVANRWLGPTVRVAALARSHRHGGSARMGVPDSVAVAAQLECGATASYHFSNWAAGSPGSRIEVYGDRGALIYRLFAEEIQGTVTGALSSTVWIRFRRGDSGSHGSGRRVQADSHPQWGAAGAGHRLPVHSRHLARNSGGSVLPGRTALHAVPGSRGPFVEDGPVGLTADRAAHGDVGPISELGISNREIVWNLRFGVCGTLSGRGPARVHHQVVPGDVTSRFGAEKEDGLGQLLGFHPLLLRDGAKHDLFQNLLP